MANTSAKSCAAKRSKVDWLQVQENAISGKRLTALSDLSAVLILSLKGFYDPRYRWQVDGLPPTDSEWNDIQHAISEMENEVMKGLIGAILPHAMADIGGFEALDCDGSIYLAADYPELYEVLSDDLKIDSMTFKVPNLNGRFPRGFETGDTVGFEGGEKEHTLTELEMPSHTHTNFPHAHSEIIAVPALGEISPGVPFPSATPSAGSTGFQSVDIDPTGGGEAHNNEPQYTIVKWLIVAR